MKDTPKYTNQSMADLYKNGTGTTNRSKITANYREYQYRPTQEQFMNLNKKQRGISLACL